MTTKQIAATEKLETLNDLDMFELADDITNELGYNFTMCGTAKDGIMESLNDLDSDEVAEYILAW